MPIRFDRIATLALCLSPVALMATANAASAAGYATQTNIVSDGVVKATTIDKTFQNPWGVAYGPGGAFWISVNNEGTSPIYSATGQLLFSVTVPAPPGQKTPSGPTGQVFNPTKGFTVTSGGKTAPASFIFVTEDGTISGWSPTVNANGVLAVDNAKSGADYEGASLYTDATGTYLLATNFATGLVEVYDEKWTLVGAFRDHDLPSTLKPFNVQTVGSALYVTYAPAVPGKANGVVEKTDLYGTVAARSENDTLNGPWGLAIAPKSWGSFAGDLLVGNLFDGRIHAFDPKTLAFVGTIDDKTGKPVAINGLWALIPGGGGQSGSASDIYFTAGPDLGKHGIFGSLAFSK